MRTLLQRRRRIGRPINFSPLVQFSGLFFSVYALDVVTKFLVRARMPLGSEISLLPFFSLVHVTNTGIAFGLFQERNAFFIGLGIVVMGALALYAVHLLRTDRFTALVLAGVLGGALGNMTDRVVHGEVTDFLDFYWGSHHWPAFNVADSAICVGAALLVIASLREGRRPTKQSPVSEL